VLTIELAEPDEPGGTRPEAAAAHSTDDTIAIAAVEAALTDLLAAALPGPQVADPALSNGGTAKLTRRARSRTPRRRLVLRRGVALRQAVLDAFARILARARAAAREAASDPETAVHDYRKSIRRARAIVSLLRPALGRTASGGLTRELRQAFQATGPIRDGAILLSTLRSIPSEDPERAAVVKALQAEPEDSGEPARAALAAGVRTLAPLPSTLRVILPATFSVADLERGLARSFRRAHRALANAASSGLETDFHEWRKRVKELRYQVELLASTGSRELARREKALATLAEELGRVTDLIVLAAEIGRRQQGGSLPDAPRLLGDIHQSIRERSRELLDRGQQLFAEPPKDFARQVLAERG